MSFAEIKNHGYYNDVAVSRDTLAILTNHSIRLVNLDPLQTRAHVYHDIDVEGISQKNTSRPRHLNLIKIDEKEWALAYISNEKKAIVLNYVTIKQDKDKCIVAGHKKHEVPKQVTGIFAGHSYSFNNGTNYFLYQNKSGEIFQYEPNVDKVEHFPIYQRLNTFTVLFEIELDGNKNTLGLTQNSKLFFGDRLITPDCTSLHVHRDFVLFTTLSTGLYYHLYMFHIKDPKFKQLVVSFREFG